MACRHVAPAGWSPRHAVTVSLDPAARQIAFEQFARHFSGALVMSPAGWAVVAAMAWSLAPRYALLAWFAAALVCWLGCLVLCLRARRGGFETTRHRRGLWAAAFLDGVGWGFVPVFLMGHDPTLDARLAAVLCGVVAVTVGVYLTSLTAMRLQIGGTWLGLGLAIVLGQGPHGSILFGLAVMHALTLVFLPGIADRVLDGIRLQEANARLAEQLRAHLVAVEEEAATDPLTGVLNRRALDRLLGRELERASAGKLGYSVLALDLDHFKTINDTHGHATGDAALRAFAERIRAGLRQTDHLARLGGEEFVVLLPGAALEQALEIAERLRLAVSEAPLLASPRVDVTVSVGVACRLDGETGPALLARADAAAYAAKRAGRDRVVTDGSSAV
jgi:diguanylate cyclase (GGDEF)-like protein